MLADFLKSILVGICAAAPLGPVAALVIQKTLCYGRRSGFVTGLGSAAIDLIYATISVFTIGFVGKFVKDNSILLSTVGGALVMCVGAFMLWKDPFRKLKHRDEKLGQMSAYFPLQAALFSLANPAAVLVMMALVALYGVGEYKLMSILGVAVGLSSWWFFFSYVVFRFRKHFNINTLVIINKILGGAVVIFGIVWILKAFLGTR